MMINVNGKDVSVDPLIQTVCDLMDTNNGDKYKLEVMLTLAQMMGETLAAMYPDFETQRQHNNYMQFIQKALQNGFNRVGQEAKAHKELINELTQNPPVKTYPQGTPIDEIFAGFRSVNDGKGDGQ